MNKETLPYHGHQSEEVKREFRLNEVKVWFHDHLPDFKNPKTWLKLGTATFAGAGAGIKVNEALAKAEKPAEVASVDSNTVAAINEINDTWLNEANGGHEPAPLCHATGSEKKPYVYIEPDCESAQFRAHYEHQNNEDIIAPVPSCRGVFIPGKNWDQEHQNIFYNDCEVPVQPTETSEPTNTPETTQTSSPTPEYTPTQHTSETPSLTPPPPTEVITPVPSLTPEASATFFPSPTVIMSPTTKPTEMIPTEVSITPSPTFVETYACTIYPTCEPCPETEGESCECEEIIADAIINAANIDAAAQKEVSNQQATAQIEAANIIAQANNENGTANELEAAAVGGVVGFIGGVATEATITNRKKKQ